VGQKNHAQENQKELLEEMNPVGYWGNKSSVVKILNLSSCQPIDRTECVRDCWGIVTFQAAFSLTGDDEWSSCFGVVTGAAVLASAKRDLRRPKQTVHPAKRRRTKATSVIQNAK